VAEGASPGLPDRPWVESCTSEPIRVNREPGLMTDRQRCRRAVVREASVFGPGEAIEDVMGSSSALEVESEPERGSSLPATTLFAVEDATPVFSETDLCHVTRRDPSRILPVDEPSDNVGVVIGQLRGVRIPPGGRSFGPASRRGGHEVAMRPH